MVQNTTKTTPDEQPEVIVEDGSGTAPVVAEEPDKVLDQGTQPDKKAAVEEEIDPREAIADRRAKMIEEANGQPSVIRDTIKGDLESGFGLVEAKPDETKGKPEDTKAVDQPKADEQLFEVIVDGETKKVTMKQLMANYQKNEAADSRLQQATQLLTEAKATVKATGTQDNQPLATPATPKDELKPKPIDPKLTAAIEKIQVGTPEEAAQALSEIIGTKATSVDPADFASRVRAENFKTDLAETTQQFFANDANKALADPTLKERTLKGLQKGMAEDIINAGATPEQMALITDGDKLVTIHSNLRANGLGRPASELLTKAAADTREWLNTITGGKPPQNGNGTVQLSQDRQERKTFVAPQPAQRTTPEKQPDVMPTATQSRRAAIQELREARGQG